MYIETKKSTIADEHYAITARIESITYLMTTDRDASDRVASLLASFTNILRDHFDHEERIMADNKYDGYDAHRKHHAYLYSNLAHYTSCISAGLIPLSKETADTFRGWVNFHVSRFDLAFQEWHSAQTSP